MGTVVAAVARAPRLSPSSRFSELVDGWLFQLGATKPAANTVAAYRRDLEGVARRLTADADVAVLHREHLTKEALRAAFASWASDHAGASVLRAHSSWSRFFDFLVAEDLVEGNPMAAVPKPHRVDGAPRAIRDPGAAARLLATAAEPDPRARDPWPERDLARGRPRSTPPAGGGQGGQDPGPRAALSRCWRLAVRLGDWDAGSTLPLPLVLSLLVAALVAYGASTAGRSLYEYGFNVETSGGHPTWHTSEAT
jgi:hypothetical protein